VEIIKKQMVLAMLMVLIVFAVFSASVAAQGLQDQTKNQQKSQISNNINSAQTNLQQSSSTSGGNNSTSTNVTNQTVCPVVNCTNSTNATVPVVNQTSNQTNVTEPSSNQTMNNTNLTNVTNQTDINTVLRNEFNQILAPVLSDTNIIRASPTQQSLNRLLDDLNLAIRQIEQLNIQINISV
jgi:type II secretory pathway pseudopilin PulG